MEQSHLENLDQIRNINITIISKNNDPFYFIGKSNDTESSQTSSEIISDNDINNTQIAFNSAEDISKSDSQTDSLPATEDISKSDIQTDSLPEKIKVNTPEKTGLRTGIILIFAI